MQEMDGKCHGMILRPVLVPTTISGLNLLSCCGRILLHNTISLVNAVSIYAEYLEITIDQSRLRKCSNRR